MVSDLQIAPDNKTISYWVNRISGGLYLIINNKEYGPYEIEDQVIYSPNGKHFAYKTLPEIKNSRTGGTFKPIIVKDGEIFETDMSANDLSINNEGDFVYLNRKIICSLDGGFTTLIKFTPLDETICVIQKGGQAKPPFTFTLKWNDKIIGRELNSGISNVFLNPSGKNLVYIVLDGQIKKYYIVSNGVKSDYYDKLYGPVLLDDNKISFWADQKEKLLLVTFDISGSIGDWKILDNDKNIVEKSSIELTDSSSKIPVLPEPQKTCTDSDANTTYPNGFNPGVKGKTSFKFPDGSMGTATDYCFESDTGESDAPSECAGVDLYHGNGKCVREYYCFDSTQLDGLMKLCPNGCFDGACI
jgi:hypothetical protein